ncbi:MAG: protein kinase [Kiritimatiellaeota bacterium]|nr:protein kinase [Kiritimatiellota bacterium]
MNISPENLERGTVIAGYRIEEAIGRGAMAVVYRAVQLNLQRSVALKVLTEELAGDQEFVARFFNEARAAAAISHPNIIQAYDAGVAEGDIYYFAMEYVEGETLQTRIVREGRLDVRPALDIALDIAGALQYGWEKQRLTHGDIKPENIMVTSEGETKLADFGLAKVAGHEYAGEGIMLTPLYAPPERIRGEAGEGDCRADIYSFGATLYHMLAGAPPFPGEDPTTVMRRHLEEAIPSLRRVAPPPPREVDEYVQRLLAKTPGERPADWAQVVRALRRLRTHCGPKAGRPVVMHQSARAQAAAASAVAADRRARGRSPVGALVAAAVLTTLLAGAGYFFYKRNATSPAPPFSAETARTVADDSEQAEWLRLKGKLGSVRDPGQAVKMLESFREVHGNKLPSDFDWYLERYKRRLETAASHGTPKTPKPEDVLARRVATVASGAGEGQLTPAERAQILREVSALIAEKALTPGQRKQLTAVRERLIGASAPEAPAERTGPIPVEARVPVAAPEQAQTPEPEFAAETRETLEADAYVTLLAQVARRGFGLQRSLEPLKESVSTWLTAHPAPSPRRELVAFLGRRVLPGATGFLRALMARKSGLVGRQLSSPKFGKRTIREVSSRGIKLAKVTRYGETAVWVPWTALDSPPYLLYLGAVAFSESERTPSLDACTSYLSVLLLTGAGKQLEQFLKRFRDAEAPEKKLWSALAADLARSPQQVRALDLWRRAREQYLLGGRVGPYRLLKRLSQNGDALLPWRKTQIEGMLRVCEEYLPEKTAGRLVRKAREQLGILPSEALALAGVAYARYGLLDFPERNSIDRIRAEALQLMSASVKDLDGPAGWRQLEPLLFSSPRRSRQFFPGLDMVLYSAMTRDQKLPAAVAAAQNILHAGALIEIGDWGKAQFFLAKADSGSIGGLPANLQSSAVFTQALIADRFGAPRRTVLKFLARMGEVPAGRSPPAALAAAQAECAVLVRAFDLEAAPWPPWSELAEQGPPPLMRQFVLASLAWLVEAGRGKEAARLISTICDDGNTGRKLGFQPGDAVFLKAVGQWLSAPEGAPLPRVTTQVSQAGHLGRLYVAAISAAPRVRPEVRDSLVDAPLLPNAGKTVFDADAWFNQCILRVDYALTTGRVKRALEIVERVLDDRSLNLTGYYARLRALQAGLETLSGNIGRARDLLGGLEWSTGSSAAERDFVRVFARPSGLDTWPRSVSPASEAGFWFGWLNWAVKAQGDPNAARPRLAAMEKCRTTQAEKALLRGLRIFCAIQPSGAEKETTDTEPVRP